jgi:hypothetical protein
MRYLYQRGEGNRRRVNHLCGYDPRTGDPTMRPVCGDTRLAYDTTTNAPVGRPTCKRCLAVLIDGFADKQ